MADDWADCRAALSERTGPACTAAIAGSGRPPRDLATAYERRGAWHANKNMLDSALRDYDAALKFDPRFARALVGRGIVNPPAVTEPVNP